METLLALDNVTTGYGKKTVLHNVSFRLEKADIGVLIGSNGAGKSTVLRAIYGLNPLWEKGEITFDGARIDGLGVERLIKKGIVYIPQKNNTFHNMSVMDNLATAGWSLSDAVSRKRIAAVLEQFPELGKNRKKKAGDLSGGQRQLLALGMGLIHRPRLILFDEPSAGLDAKRMRGMFGAIANLKQESRIASLIVEHRVQAISEIADRFIGLKLGKIHATFGKELPLHGEAAENLFI
uniref:Branched-chain amino acid transport system ATP-binding protein n=1 Tax=Candidatus Kentrum sp. DK TaxID=2126562 RepID=A0A450TK23_9GAMM|nr:MAG: branched-chain amino acid transport system ATP-binding protein [Candidatus Kentron sp. DK]